MSSDTGMRASAQRVLTAPALDPLASPRQLSSDNYSKISQPDIAIDRVSEESEGGNGAAAAELSLPVTPSRDENEPPSPVSPPSPGITVVFLREGVSIRPTPTSSINGRMSLVKQHHGLFVTWLPYGTVAGVAAGAAASPAAASSSSSSYAVYPIPLSDVRAIHPHTPPLRQHSVTLVLQSGATLPTFYFNLGGVKALLAALREHANLMPSPRDPGAYLINDLADPLTRSLTSLQLTNVLPPSPPPEAAGGFGGTDAFSWPLAKWQVEDMAEDGEGSPTAASSSTRGHFWDLAERVGRLTQGAKEAASSFLASGALPQLQGPTLVHTGDLSSPTVAAGEKESDAEEGESRRRSADRQNGEGKGGGRAIGHKPQPSPSSTPPSPRSAAAAGWELIVRSVSSEFQTAPRWARPRPPPLSLEELQAMADPTGRLLYVEKMRDRAFYGGIEPSARPEAWKMLLGLHAPGSSRKERAEEVAVRLKKYLSLRRQWQTIASEQAARFSMWRERRGLVDKDVRRTDSQHPFFRSERGPSQTILRRILLTHVMWNFDLGYCQGMSDVASPLLVVARSAAATPRGQQLTAEEQNAVEAEAFWMFASVMEGLQDNFSTDCNGMHAQLAALRRLLALLDAPLHAHLARHDALSLFFCYRWVLILFKREFAFDDVLRLWEALWARPADQLHLYLAVAMLSRERRRILENNLDFDGLLELCVGLAGKIELEVALSDAEMLRECAGEAGAAIVAGLPSLLPVKIGEK